MIYSLNGVVLSKCPDNVVIECGGVGYFVSIPTSVYADISDIGKNMKIYTYQSVKEDGIDLFGFSNETQRSCFKTLISVSGVGAKTALGVLSLYAPEKISLMIAAGDYKAFTACPGIGSKTAQRLVLELKDKVKVFASEDISISFSQNAIASGNTAETIAALVSLGFSTSEAAQAVSKLSPDLSTEDMVSHALRSLARKD